MIHCNKYLSADSRLADQDIRGTFMEIIPDSLKSFAKDCRPRNWPWDDREYDDKPSNLEVFPCSDKSQLGGSIIFRISHKHLNLGAVLKSQLSQLPATAMPEPPPAALTTSAGAAVCRSPHRFHGGMIFWGSGNTVVGVHGIYDIIWYNIEWSSQHKYRKIPT